ncbi:MAG TPA: T9SS type A sorting domain-containing protein [Bacteroidetes bacterium]|nr:T9SS type A sorting domain-containing protein [Bacteroidota bacterium]
MFVRVLSLIIITLYTSFQLLSQCDGRYYDKIFGIEQEMFVPFGKNADYKGDTVYLSMHINQPKYDTFLTRPLIIFAFGGSFTAGVKESPDILHLCDEFTRRGYVTATIDYRLGFENGNDSDTNQLKAVFRGIQDAKAAIRFFYKDASTINKYKIDTHQIFMGGVSAGGFISLNLAYYKANISVKPPPQWSIDAVNEIGGVEGNSGNAGYSTKIKGVINLCGALADTLWLQPGDPILVSLHGSNDALVPFGTDTVSTAVEASFHGSETIHKRAANIDHIHKFHPFLGAGHVPFVLPIPFIPPASYYMDTTVKVIRDFLYENVICDPYGLTKIEDYHKPHETLSIIPNPANDITNLLLNSSSDNTFSIILFDHMGRKVIETKIRSNLKTSIDLSQLEKGIYILHCVGTSKSFSKKLLVK